MKSIKYNLDTMDDFHKLERKAISHKATSSNSQEALLPCGGVLKSVDDHWVGVYEYTIECPLMSGSRFMTASERQKDREVIELSKKIDAMSKEEIMKSKEQLMNELQAIYERDK